MIYFQTINIILFLLIIILFFFIKYKNRKIEFFLDDNKNCKLIWSKIYSKNLNFVCEVKNLSENNILIYSDFKNLKQNSYILQNLKTPFKILFHFGDYCLPIDKRTNQKYYNIKDFYRIYNNKNLKEIWCINYDYRNYNNLEKIKFLPLGLDFHTISERNEWGEKKKTTLDQEQELIDIYEKYGGGKRLHKIFICNSNNTSKHIKKLGYVNQDRKDILNDISNNKNITKCQGFIRRNELWKTFCQYKFVICPVGNGLDTHRLWESLYLGCIAIVQSCSLDPMMDGFPVVIVEDFNNITSEDLDTWYKKYYHLTQDKEVRKKYESKYWIEKINKF